MVKDIRFKDGYTRYLRNSLYIVIVIHFLIFYFSPEFEFEPYVLSEIDPFDTVKIADDYDIPKELEDIVQPVVPMPIDDPDRQTMRPVKAIVSIPIRFKLD